MSSVASGDRVKILCSSSLRDGTYLDTDEVRNTPYWIRAGTSGVTNGASEAVLGMCVGDRKTVTTAPRDSRAVTLELLVVDIRVPSYPTLR